MRFSTASRRAAAGATIFAACLAVTACGTQTPADNTSTGSGDQSQTAAAETIELTIGTFNNFGFEAATDTAPGADLFNKYMAEHPNIKIVSTVAKSSDDARNAFNTAIGAGSGAYDIQAVDIDWMPSIMDNADKFVDVKDLATANDYLDWKIQQATTADGKVLGFGTDIGPEGICYRTDLFEAAGLPTDRDEVAKLLTGDWDTYFSVGKEYTAKTGKAWFDSAAATYQGMVNQVESSYISKDDDSIIASTNAKIKEMYDQVTTAAVTDKESAGLQQWSDDWNAAFKSDKFATMLCPAWIVNNIKGNAGEDNKNWDIADVFPGGGGNWGGSFLVIPAQGKNTQAAAELAAWLTAPEQQAAVFVAASNYPSSKTAEAAADVAGKTDSFLNDAPVGQIFANRAAAVTVVPYKGAEYFDIQSKMADALNRVDVTKEMSAADSWNKWLEDVKALS
ncbi:MAG: extracellular solute-binding protein [Propionibacteriaceae bacterium]|nr:extracellular solute-binding protein [Propionibacteriaceae bacterium]